MITSHRKCSLVFILIVVQLTLPLIAQPFSQDKPYSTSIETDRRTVRAFLTTSGIPGMAVAVGLHGKIVWEEAFGIRDLESTVSSTSDTRFRLGSVSKILTVAAASRLVDLGLLDLDAPVQKYVPTLPDTYKDVTPRLLLGHLAGVRHYKDSDDQYECRHFNSVSESLSIFIADPLLHPTGSKYLYSTFGFVLLSAVLEGAANKNFQSILQDQVLEPLQMKNTVLDDTRKIIAGRTRFYEREEGKIENAPFEDPSYKWAAGGILSTVSDLVRFGMGHLSGTYLKESTRQTIFTKQHTKDGQEVLVGLGWRIGSDWAGRRIYHHAGNQAGARAILMLYPDEELVIAILTNLTQGPPFVEETAQMLAASFLPGMELQKKSDISGRYQLTGTFQDNPYTAELSLEKAKGSYDGKITGNFPLLQIAAKNKAPEQMRITNVFDWKENTVIVTVSPLGILQLILYPGTTERTGLMEVGPFKTSFQLKKI